MRDEADALLLPSLHDSAPWVVGEALSMGVPAVCLDQGGAPALGATCVPLRGLANTAVSLAKAVRLGPLGPLPRSDIDSRYLELRTLLLRRGILPDTESQAVHERNDHADGPQDGSGGWR